MAIRALSRQEFDRFRSAQRTLASLTRKAVEWFADDTGDVIGAIADHHGSDLNWSFVALGRHLDGNFRVFALDFGFPSADDARRLLFAKMETALGTDEALAASSSRSQ
jgi:hypothetical protein